MHSLRVFKLRRQVVQILEKSQLYFSMSVLQKTRFSNMLHLTFLDELQYTNIQHYTSKLSYMANQYTCKVSFLDSQECIKKLGPVMYYLIYRQKIEIDHPDHRSGSRSMVMRPTTGYGLTQPTKQSSFIAPLEPHPSSNTCLYYNSRRDLIISILSV